METIRDQKKLNNRDFAFWIGENGEQYKVKNNVHKLHVIGGG